MWKPFWIPTACSEGRWKLQQAHTALTSVVARCDAKRGAGHVVRHKLVLRQDHHCERAATRPLISKTYLPLKKVPKWCLCGLRQKLRRGDPNLRRANLGPDGIFSRRVPQLMMSLISSKRCGRMLKALLAVASAGSTASALNHEVRSWTDAYGYCKPVRSPIARTLAPRPTLWPTPHPTALPDPGLRPVCS